ncbi:MAG TPA: formate dehydrogenase subunit delta [Candidatus Binataceae bacterium]|nr:formate dehydrogenase subunit delta [Candidatus Binataceae bacterium]
MDRHHLISMANDIGGFFATMPDHEEAVTAMAQHLRNFWEPRMRHEILAYNREGGSDLVPLARDAIARLELERKPD